MIICGIDPGLDQSAYVLFDTKTKLPVKFGILPNKADDGLDMIDLLKDPSVASKVVIEMMGGYGLVAGRDHFRTCVWIGRFEQIVEDCHRRKVVFIERPDIKVNICNSRKAKDSNIVQAIKDRYGGSKLAKGRAGKKGPLYGFKADCWQALAVALTYADLHVDEV